MKKCLGISVLMIFFSFFSRCGLYCIETLVNQKNKKRVVFFSDVHNKNHKAHTRLVLERLKKLADSQNFSILIEGSFEYIDRLKPQKSLLSEASRLLYSYGNVTVDDCRTGVFRRLAVLLDMYTSKKITNDFPYNFKEVFLCFYDDEKIVDLKMNLYRHYYKNDLEMFPVFAENSVEKKESDLLMKDINDSASCLSSLHSDSCLSSVHSDSSLFSKLYAGVLCSLPELYWFKTIYKLVQKYSTTIVYLGGAHCDNLRQSLIRCGYTKDDTLSCSSKSDDSLLSCAQVRQFFDKITEPSKPSRGIKKQRGAFLRVHKKIKKKNV